MPPKTWFLDTVHHGETELCVLATACGLPAGRLRFARAAPRSVMVAVDSLFQDY